MPLYEFTNKEHGISVTVPFAVNDRPNAITLVRTSVPSRLMIGTGAKPETHSDKLRKGYKQLEDSGGLRATAGKNYLPVSTIKRALAMPETAD